MTDQTVNLAARIFPYMFPNNQALFTFDNAANHTLFAKNAILAKKINLRVGRKQPWMKNSFNNATQKIYPTVFLEDYYDFLLQSKPKRLKQILIEKSLWRNRALNSLLKCPTSHNRLGYNLFFNSDCYDQALMSNQPDFERQRGCLREDVEAAGHLLIFYPKFHFEPNFIDRYSSFLFTILSHFTDFSLDFSVQQIIMHMKTTNIT